VSEVSTSVGLNVGFSSMISSTTSSWITGAE
jgi:hypothetical protein